MADLKNKFRFIGPERPILSPIVIRISSAHFVSLLGNGHFTDICCRSNPAFNRPTLTLHWIQTVRRRNLNIVGYPIKIESLADDARCKTGAIHQNAVKTVPADVVGVAITRPPANHARWWRDTLSGGCGGRIEDEGMTDAICFKTIADDHAIRVNPTCFGDVGPAIHVQVRNQGV